MEISIFNDYKAISPFKKTLKQAELLKFKIRMFLQIQVKNRK